MARITTTSQKKKMTIPGIAYPATDLALATGASYPSLPGLFSDGRFISAMALVLSWLAGESAAPVRASSVLFFYGKDEDPEVM